MMKIFDLFKKKAPSAPEIAPEGDYINWPSLPDENQKVPSLESIVEANSSLANDVKLLKGWCVPLVLEEDSIEYQVVMESQYGLFCIPAMLRKGDSGGFLAFYSHAGEWDDSAFEVLLNWVIKLRGCDFVHGLKIVICEEKKTLPIRVQEITSRRREHRMMVSQVPHLRKGEPQLNARIFAEAFGFFCNENKILNYDGEALAQLERWYKDEVRGCLRSSFYYPLYCHFIGSFFGQIICEQFQGTWEPLGNAHVVVIAAKKLKPRQHGMMPGEMKVNVFQLTADFVFNPRADNSLLNNFRLVQSELK